MLEFFIKQHDTAPSLQITCEDSGGNAIDIAGATVKFFMKTNDLSAFVVNGATAVNEQTGSGPTAVNKGVVQYNWVPADTANTGEFQAEFEVTFGGGQLETFPNTYNILVHIVPDLG